MASQVEKMFVILAWNLQSLAVTST